MLECGVNIDGHCVVAMPRCCMIGLLGPTLNERSETSRSSAPNVVSHHMASWACIVDLKHRKGAERLGSNVNGGCHCRCDRRVRPMISAASQEGPLVSIFRGYLASYHRSRCFLPISSLEAGETAVGSLLEGHGRPSRFRVVFKKMTDATP